MITPTSNGSYVHRACIPVVQIHENFINQDTTEEEFDDKYYQIAGMDEKFCWDTQFSNHQPILSNAAECGNTLLIDYIVKTKGPFLLFTYDEFGFFPLHLTVRCKDSDIGLLAAKKIIQLGAPITIERPICDFYKEQGKNLLEMALYHNSIKIAALCLRSGMFLSSVSEDHKQTYESARKEIMTQNERLFRLQFNFLRQQNVIDVPNDIINYISYLSVKLD